MTRWQEKGSSSQSPREPCGKYIFPTVDRSSRRACCYQPCCVAASGKSAPEIGCLSPLLGMKGAMRLDYAIKGTAGPQLESRAWESPQV